MVSKAFQVLSDSNKRAIFDQTGGDPDVRGGGGGGGGGGGMSSGFGRSGFAGQQFGGQQFGGEEMSPEDLFRFFFGGNQAGGFGGGGSPFGGGGFSFHGPGGVRMGGQQPRRRPGQPEPASTPTSTWLQVLPLLMLFAFSILTQLPSLFGMSGPADPDFDFSPSARYSVPQHTHSDHAVPYFVIPHQFAAHPIYADVLDANPQLNFQSKYPPGTAHHKKDLHAHLRKQQPLAMPVDESAGTTAAKAKPKLTVPKSLAKFEREVEKQYTHVLHQHCRHQIEDRNDQLQRARGIFGIGADWDRVQRLTDMRLDKCEELRRMGVNMRY